MTTLHTSFYTRNSDGRFGTKGYTARELNDFAEAAGRKLYQQLIALDPDGGEAWFDDDNNIPDFGLPADRNKLLRARIAELEADARCRHTHTAIDYTGSMRLVGGEIIDDQTEQIICLDCHTTL